MSAMSLSLDPEQLNTCVACGLCLPHCPTYRATGDEALSPRGRIEAMRAVQWRGAPIDEEFVGYMSTCVQCRGCEPACPSAVPYGDLIEHTRTALASQRRITPRWQRLGLGLLLSHATVERYGGSIELGNAPGGGTIATLRLPRAGNARRTSA